MAVVVAGAIAGCARPAHESAPRERDAGFERVGIDELASDGATSALVDGVTHDGGAVVVGSVAGEEDAPSDGVAPLVLESADGIDWQRTELAPLDAPASLVAVAAGADGTVLAAGAVAGASGSAEPALWRRDGDGQWGDPVTPDELPRDLSIVPHGLAGGPAGFMLAGSRGDGFEVWTSADGDRWHRASSGSLKAPPLVVVGEEFVALLDSADPEAGTVDVLVAAGGGELERVDRIEGSPLIHLDDAAYVDGHYLAVGATRSTDDEFAPATWISEGPSSWSAGPRLEDASSEGSTAGNWATSVAAGGDGRVLVTSLAGHVWASDDDSSGAHDDELALFGDSSAPDGSAALLPAGVPTVFTSDSIFGADDDGWEDRASFVIPSPARAVRVTGVAHGHGSFVAVGSQRRLDVDGSGESRVQGLVWRSADGRAWESLPTEPALAGTALLDVGPYEGGFVAVGYARDEAAPGVGRIFVSVDGTDWEKVEGDDLRPPPGGIHQLESVVAYGDGFIATGWGSNGTRIAPLILVSSGGSSVVRAAVPASPRGDQISLGACAAGDKAVVVGGAQEASSTSLAWRSGDGSRWEHMPAGSPDPSGLIVCSMSSDGAIVAGGTVAVAGGDSEGPGVATNASLEMRPLPGGHAGDLVTGAGWVGDVPVLVGSPRNEVAGPGALVWLATGKSALDWTRLTSADLQAPGVRNAQDVASGEGTVVVVGNALTGGAAWTASAEDVLDG